MYREQVRLFEKQIREAEEMGCVELAGGVREMTGRTFEAWGKRIGEFEDEYPSPDKFNKSSGSSKTGNSFLKHLEEAIEKATVLQKCESALLDKLRDQGAETRQVEERCKEWERVVSDLRECWDFYYKEIELDVKSVEGAFERIWGRARGLTKKYDRMHNED